MGDADRVRCATYMFRDDTSLWWEGAKQSTNLATLSWARFKEIFYEKYFTADVRWRLKREFMSLRQGGSTVAEFVRKFDRGCHFVPLTTRDVTEKFRHFMDGLRPTIRHNRKRQQHQNNSQANKKPYPRPPRPQGPPKPQGQVKKPGPPKPPQLGAPKPAEGPPCKNCNRLHYGQCMWGTTKCFICKEEDHKATDCPKKREPTVGRAYVMHVKDAQEDAGTTLITGRTFILGVATYALLVSGATHSFISETFVKKLNIIHEDMGLGFKVFIPSDDQIITSIVKNLELRLSKDVVRADPIVLHMPEFDIILGMNWLSKNGASINFRHKSVSIRPPNGKSFVFETTRNKQMPHIISCMCARKLTKRECQAFLVCVTTTHAPISQKLQDVNIVRDFPCVSPEDIYGILPDREAYLDQFVIVLIDDILTYSKSRGGHYPYFRTKLQVLQDRKLVAKFSKCDFWPERVALLGHIISRDGVEVDPSKVEAVREWPKPKIVTEIRSFLGLAGYYRKFIQGFSYIAVPLTSLTKKNTKFIWGSECQDSFDKLKQALITAPMLSMPSGQGEYVIYTDTSKFCLGAVLMQNDRIISYASRQLKVHEKHYPTHDLELAAVVFVLKIW
ncbi:uncharacterized protein [Primulina eburnea]|uniref:uncharacterized protein n=1 Tax=Primulina eburnea TaxID=1245227 RepID=UPI003C6C21FC